MKVSLKQKIEEKAKTSKEIAIYLHDAVGFAAPCFIKKEDVPKRIAELENARWVSVDVVYGLLDKAIAEIKNSPFRRMDMQIEGEVRNARRNWKRCKKKGTNQVTDEDFERILKTMRIKIDDVLSVLGVVEAEKQK